MAHLPITYEYKGKKFVLRYKIINEKTDVEVLKKKMKKEKKSRLARLVSIQFIDTKEKIRRDKDPEKFKKLIEEYKIPEVTIVKIEDFRVSY